MPLQHCHFALAITCEEAPIDDILALVDQIVPSLMQVLILGPFLMQHNVEPEAVDLLMEVKDLDRLLEHMDKTNFKRPCLYLTSSAKLLDRCFGILPLAQYIKQIFHSSEDLLLKKQCCYILGHHGITLELDEDMVTKDDEREALQEILNNAKLSEGYLILARDVEVIELKSYSELRALMFAYKHLLAL